MRDKINKIDDNIKKDQDKIRDILNKFKGGMEINMDDLYEKVMNKNNEHNDKLNKLKNNLKKINDKIDNLEKNLDNNENKYYNLLPEYNVIKNNLH